MPVLNDTPEAGWLDPSTGQWVPNLNAGTTEPPATTTPPPSSSEPAPSEPTAPSSTGDTWKPDFTADDPWKDMPPDYKGVATFTPTAENPVPPWEGTEGAAKAGIPEFGTPEYDAKATEIATKYGEPVRPSTYEQDLVKYDTVLKSYEKEAQSFDQKWSGNIQDGEFVGSEAEYDKYKKDFERLDKKAAHIETLHSSVSSKGKKAKEEYEKERAQFERDNVKLGNNTWMPKESFDKLSPEAQQLAMDKGYEAVYEQYQKEVADFEKGNVKLPADLYHPDGTWITKESFDKLPKDAQQLALTRGLTALQNTYEAKNAPDAAKLLPADVYEAYKDQSPQDKFAILKAYGVVPENAEYVKSDAQGNPMFQKGSGMTEAIVNSKNLPLLAADVLVPGVATVRHWKDMGAGERAFSLALDALILIPIAGGAGRAARASMAVTRSGRALAAAKGVGKEALLQLKAPIDTVLHPIQTVKSTAGGARNLVENIVSPRKLSEVVITTTNGTVRIPVEKVKTAEQANAARNSLMNIAKRTGETPVIEMNGVRYELARSPLMKELGGGLAHATPMGQNFAELNTKVAKEFKVEGNLYLSHEPLPRFARQTATGTGGPRPTIVILSPTLAKDAKSSAKLFRHTAELEAVLPDQYVIPKYTQRLYTRIGPDHTRVDILLVDKKLSPAQIVKLKGLAAVEDFKSVVTPGVLISGKPAARGLTSDKTLTPEEVKRLAAELRASGNQAAARSLLKASGLLGAGTSGDLVATASMRSGDRRIEDIITVRATGRPRERVGAGRSDAPVAFRTSRYADMTGRVSEERLPTPEEIARRTGRDRIERRGPAPRRRGRAPDDRRPPTGPDDRRPPEAPSERRPPEGPDDRRPPVTPEDRRPPAPPEDRRPPEPPEDRKPPQPPEQRKPPEPPDEGKPPRPPTEIRKGGEGRGKDWTERDYRSAVAWKQGFGIWAIKEPYGNEDWKFFEMDNVPEGLHISKDQKTAFATIQLYKGKRPPVNVSRDLGIVFAHINRPTRQAGKRGAIHFTPDRADMGRRKSGLVSVKRGRVYHTRIGKGKVLSRQPISGASVRKR